MVIQNKLKNEMKEISLFTISCILYCILIKILFHISTEILFRYFLCQVLIVLLPGYVFINIISFKCTFIERISISYSVGYVFNIIEYLIVYGLQLQRFAQLFCIIIAIIAWGLLRKKRNTVNKSLQVDIDDDWFMLLSFFVLYILINIISYSGNAVSPFNGRGMTEFARDIQFWGSNAVALKIGFPPVPTYLDGGILYYHYFSSMQVAFLSQVSGIDIFTLSFTLFSFGKCIMLLGGLNYLLNILGTKKSKFFYFLVILFMTGKETVSLVTYAWHTIQGPFGFDIGYAFGMWFLGIFIGQWKCDKFDVKLFGLCMLFWLTLTGTKAPIAMVLIFAAAIVCFIWIVCKNYKNAFVYGGCIVGIFLVVSIVFAGALRIANGRYEGVSNKLLTFYSIKDILTVTHSNVILSFIHTIIRYVYYTQPVLTIITIITSGLAIYYYIHGKFKWNEYILAMVLLITTIIGLFMGIFIMAGGRSEMYFSMTAFIPCISYNAELWRQYYDKGLIYSEKQLQICKIGMLIISIIGIYNMVFNTWDGGLAVSLYNGNKKICGNYMFPNGSFSKDEALACMWIRDNTNEEAMVLTDRYVFAEKHNDYYVGIFSERQQYLEASDLIYVIDLNSSYKGTIEEEILRRTLIINGVYSNNVDSFEQLKNEGVNYIIQNQLNTPDFQSDSSLIEFQYRSGSVTVYKIL